MLRGFLLLVLIGMLSGCEGENPENIPEQPVRGLKTFLIADTEQTTIRRYPSVLQPGSVSTLSFEISGRLNEVNLDVGQVVKKGDLLAEIDTRSLEISS